MSKDWLKKLQVGDPVMEMVGSRIKRTSEVIRLTKTQVIVLAKSGIEERYRIKDGRMVGNNDVWHSFYILPIDEERLNRQRYEVKMSRCRRTLAEWSAWKDASDEVVMKCFAIRFPDEATND